MKTFISIILTFSLFLVSIPLQAQNNESLNKEIKSLMKDLKKYKSLKEEDKMLEAEIATLQKQVSMNRLLFKATENELAQKDLEIANLRNEVGSLGRKVTSSADGKLHEVVFRVQIGAYQNQKIATILENQTNFIKETSPEGLTKFMLGNFTSYHEAKQFSEKLGNAGAQSYVVGYVDNVRVPNLKQMPVEYF
jgi:cell division protein FtsB